MRKTILLGSMAALTLFACSKLKESPEPVNPEPVVVVDPGNQNDPKSFAKTTHTDVKDIIATEKPTHANFSVPVASGKVFTTADKIDIVIPADAFMDASGNPITGNVDINVVEFTTPADLIFGNVQTVSNDGKLLESGGMVKLEALHNGSPALLRPGKTVNFNFKNSAAETDMTAWMGQKAPDGAIQWGAQNSWLTSIDTTQIFNMAGIDSMTWINLDRFMKQGSALSSMIVHLPDGYTSAGGSFRLVFKDVRSCAPLRDDATDKSIFSTGNYYKVPVGRTVIAICTVIHEGYLRYYQKEITLTDNMELTLTESDLEFVSEADLKAKLKSLSF